MNKIQATILVVIVLIFGIIIVITQSNTLGLDDKADDQVSISEIPESITIIPTQSGQQQQTQQAQQTQVNMKELEQYKVASATAVISTNKGAITMVLYGEDAPYTVANFIKKSKDGYYNNLTFHRVEDWVLQGGDPLGNGTGGGNMPVEFNDKPFLTGSVGIASRGDNVVQNDSQFFFTKSDSSFLNGKYTNFGIVTEGMDVVNKMEIGDKILKITIQ